MLGAGLTPSGELSPFLAERVATAVELYRQGRVQALLMSGDLSRVEHDEVTAMAEAAEAVVWWRCCGCGGFVGYAVVCGLGCVGVVLWVSGGVVVVLHA